MSRTKRIAAKPLEALLTTITPSNAVEVMNDAFARKFDVDFQTDEQTGAESVVIHIEIDGKAAELMHTELNRQYEKQERQSKAAARRTLRLAKKYPAFREAVNSLRARVGAEPI